MSVRSTIQWYLNQPGDLDLENIKRVVDNALMPEPGLPAFEAPVEGLQGVTLGRPLTGRYVALVVGHEPGGGAWKEREWNLVVADLTAQKLRDMGAEVYIHLHRTKNYSLRMEEMRAGIKKHAPKAECVLSLHYNGVDYPEAHGHEFHYRSVPAFAKAIRDSWQKHFPWSKARRVNGIFENRAYRGWLMLKVAPAAACLVEPFFISNPEEKTKIFESQEEVANVYAEGILNFLTK